MKYKIRLWFDFGGFCLWGMNENTKEKFGYAIDPRKLELTNLLINKLEELQNQYATYLDMSDPMAPTSWSKEKNDFFTSASEVCAKIQQELGSDYEIINEVEKNIT